MTGRTEEVQNRFMSVGSIFLQELEDFLDFYFSIFGIPRIEGILDTMLEVGF
tara:strand:- start:334 stop:489 length:156 start_codon:yes stop_codon:yes gene_type:complete